MLGYTWKLRVMVFTTNLAVIGVFVLLGLFLDQQFGTKPKLLFAGLIISFPITQIFSKRFIKRYFKKYPID